MSYEGLLRENSGTFTITAKMLRISTVSIDVWLTMLSIYSFPLQLRLCLDTFVIHVMLEMLFTSERKKERNMLKGHNR